jgi:lysophospholipase L1-like esterase
MRRIKVVLFLLLWAGVLVAQDQKPAFWEDVQAFKKQDSVSVPPKNAILFIGSSSFTMWKDVNQYFPGYRIINRAFGGSTLVDQLRYVREVVFPYKPKQVIIYCGENDLAASDTVDANDVANRFKSLFTMIRNKFPKTYIVYVSMKPSPSRHMLASKMIGGNELIKKYLSSRSRTAFIDIYKEMIDDEGKPKEELFLEDNLHMNKIGYAIWKKAIEPYLRK